MRTVMVALLTVLVLGTAAHAELYHWEDERGKKHFSDTPPADQEVETIEVQPPPKIGQGEREQAITERLQELREQERVQDMTPEELEEDKARKDEEREKQLQFMK